MDDRESLDAVATEIAQWQDAAQRLPLPELTAMVATWQDSLADSLNGFNDILASQAACDEPASEYALSIGQVTRRATAIAIFTLGISQRIRLTAQQN
jgi:hypothetical protein